MTDTIRSGPGTSAPPRPPEHQAQETNRHGSLQQPVVLLTIVGSFLAVSTIIAKAGPGFGWHPLALLQWSILGGAVCLFLATRAFGTEQPDTTGTARSISAGRLLRYFFASGLLFIAPNMVAVMAASRVGAGFVSLCYAFPLVLTYAFAVLLRLERFQMMRAAGVVAGLTGGVLLAVSGADVSVDASGWSLFALSIPVFLAVGNIYRTLKWPQGVKPVDLALGMMAAGFFGLTTFNALFSVPVGPQTWTIEVLGLLLAQVLIFALQYGLYFRLQKTAGPVYLSQIGSVAAVVGLGLGYLAFGEVPDAAKLGAVIAVGAGIVMVTLGKSR